MRSRANHRSSTAPALAQVASTRARSTSAPVAAPPACTTLGLEWPPSRARASTPDASRSNSAPRVISSRTRCGPLVHQHPYGVLVTEVGPGGQRVGQVQVGRVLVPAEHRGHAPLGPPGGRLGEVALGQHAHPEGATVDTGQPDGRRQAGHPAAEHEHVEGTPRVGAAQRGTPAPDPAPTGVRFGPRAWPGRRVVDEADRSHPGGDQQPQAPVAVHPRRDAQVVGVDHRGVVQLGQGLGLDHGGHGRHHGDRRHGTGVEGSAAGVERPEEHPGCLPLVARQADVAAREGQPVGARDRRAPDDLHREGEVGDQPAHQGQLLEVLLAEVGPAAAGHGEELGHHRRHPVEVPRSGRSLPIGRRPPRPRPWWARGRATSGTSRRGRGANTSAAPASSHGRRSASRVRG